MPKTKELNMKLLVAVTSIQSSYSEDTQINKFIESHLASLPGVTVHKDAYGNIYGTKGEGKNGYKCIVAHTDTVHQIYSNRKIFILGDTLFAMADNPSKTGSPITQVGVGGDDKAGVYAALQAMDEFDNIKSVFFRFEETGCKGSREADMNFFEDCNFVVQLDRKGNSDFITHTNGIKVASAKFDETMKEVYSKYGFSSIYGVSTDVGALKSNGLKVSACNISSGYFDPHTRLEVIDTKGLHNAYMMVSEMFEKHGDTRFEHEYVRPIPIRTAIASGFRRTTDAVQTALFSDNYFARTIRAVNNTIYTVVNSGKSPRFLKNPQKIGWPTTYKFLDNDMIDVDSSCPECGARESVAYLTEDRCFMCMDSAHNEFIHSPELSKRLKIAENGKIYVYNKLYDFWLEKGDAKWSDELETYVVK